MKCKTGDIKIDIRKCIEERCQPSFAELMALPGFAGDEILGCPDVGIVLWDKISKPAAAAIIDLLECGEIDVGHAHIDVYLHADEFFIPAFPLATTSGPYEPPCWIPILFKMPAKATTLN